MKILAIGDFHGKFPEKLRKEAKNAELILCTGDFGGSEKLLKIIFKYFYQKWWEKVGNKKARKLVLEDYNSGKKIIEELGKLKKPVYTIFGNWDFDGRKHKERTAGLKLKEYSDLIKKQENLHLIRRKIKKIDNLKIFAFGGQVTAGDYLKKQKFFSDKQRQKYIRKNNLETKQIMRHPAKDIDILLAHYPAYGFFDKVKYKGKNPMNGKSAGVKFFTEAIKRYHPEFVLCGHMHEYQGVKKLGKTQIIATGSAAEGKAVMINYPEKGKIKLKFLR